MILEPTTETHKGGYHSRRCDGYDRVEEARLY
jgi:hypothetical protein